MGRLVSTAEDLRGDARTFTIPLKMLVLSNPQGNLSQPTGKGSVYAINQIPIALFR
jgi:hypothetical protein